MLQKDAFGPKKFSIFIFNKLIIHSIPDRNQSELKVPFWKNFKNGQNGTFEPTGDKNHESWFVTPAGKDFEQFTRNENYVQ